MIFLIDDIESYLSKEDLLKISSKYSVKNLLEHEIRVGNFSMQLFDAMIPIYKFNNCYRNLLYYSALLHDIGYFVEKKKHQQHSKELILEDSCFKNIPIELKLLLGITVMSHGKLLDYQLYFYPEELQINIKRLISILRIADALDHKHNCNLSLEKVILKKDELNLGLKGSIEQVEKRFERKSKLFSQVFPLTVVIDSL